MQTQFVTFAFKDCFFALVLGTTRAEAYWCNQVQCVRLIYIYFFNITLFLHNIICIMAKADVVERETEFSTGTALLNERQTLAFL